MGRCGACRGRGSILETSALGNRIVTQTCYSCGGTGGGDSDEPSGGPGCLAILGFWLVTAIVCVIGLFLLILVLPKVFP